MADDPGPIAAENADSSSEDEFYDTLTDLSRDEGHTGGIPEDKESEGELSGTPSMNKHSPVKDVPSRLPFEQDPKPDEGLQCGAGDEHTRMTSGAASANIRKMGQESQQESRNSDGARGVISTAMEGGDTECPNPGGGAPHEELAMPEISNGGQLTVEGRGNSGDRLCEAERTEQTGDGSDSSVSSSDESGNDTGATPATGATEEGPSVHSPNPGNTSSTFHEGLATEAAEPESDEGGPNGSATEGVDGVDGQTEDDDDGLAALEELENQLTDTEKEDRKNQAQQLKKEGNDLYKGGEYLDAIYQYSEALKLCPLAFKKVRSIMYANRAACRIHVEQKEGAVKDCSKALDLHPHYMKVILRRAQTYELLEKLDEALADYQKALELDPGCHTARAACMRLPEQINERNEKMKAEMMDKLKDLGNMVLRPFGLSTNNFQMQQDPNSGSYSVNFVQNEKNNGK